MSDKLNPLIVENTGELFHITADGNRKPLKDESRLLPELATIPEELSGHPVVYDYQSGIDADTLCLLHLDDSTWADATGKNTITQHGNVAKVSDSGYFSKALDLSGNQSSGSLSWLTVPWLAEYEAATWTMEFFAKPTKSVVNFMFFSFGDSQGSYLSLGSQNLTNLWLGNGSGTYTGNFSFSLNTWYWFVIQYDGSAVKVYVDGQLVVQGNFTPNYVGQDLQFGNLNLVNNQDNTFIGYLDEFRWSKGLRYPTGVMTAPTEPYGTPAKRYKVSEASLVFSDSTRLLPEDSANGDIPCFDATATVGGGNDANTKLLIQPETSNNQILDQAAGNAAPVGITNSGNVAIAANALVFSGENALIIEPDTLGMTLGGNNEYSIEVDFQLDQVKSDWATLFGGDGSMTRSAFYINSSGATAVQGGIAPNTTGWTTGTRHRLTIERFQDGDSWKTVIYRNGAVLATSVTTPNTLSGDRFPIGSNLEGTGRNFVGKIWAFRISNKAIHGGQSFTPDALPWTKPQTVGEWSKLNKSNLVLKSDLPSPKEDIVFTSTSLSNSKLIVENATVGTFAILDNSNSLVIPNMKQVGTSVEVDFTGWTVTGNWTIKFVSNTSVSGGGGGVTKDEVTSIAIEAAIIFG